MSFLKQHNKRAFILGMMALSFLVIVFSYFYYSDINASKDPRVKQARELYEKYNDYAIKGNFDNVFNLLDSVEYIYSNINHYSKSFEIGVLYNNRAAMFLTMAIHNNTSEKYSGLSKDSLLILAMNSANKSILLYEKWLSIFEKLNDKEINELISNDFFQSAESYSNPEKEKFLKSRVKEIETSQYETKRRLSVAYTNFGTIQRHKEQYKDAIESYQKAIVLWDQNLTAENNLNILLGKPLKKRSLIQKLFPPKQKET